MDKKPSCCSPAEVKPVSPSSCCAPSEVKIVAKSSCCAPSEIKTTPQSSCCPSTKPKKKIDYLLWGSFFPVAILFVLASVSPVFLTQINWLNEMAMASFHMIHSIWWAIILGMVFVGFLGKIPREFIIAILGKGGTVSGLVRATGAGVLLDLCSHGILMVGVKLYERGASAGQVIAFLLASPWNSFSLTLILIGLIGLKWTLAFIVLSMVIALITGFVFDLLVKRGKLPNNPNQISLPEEFNFWQDAKLGIKTTQYDYSYFKSVLINGVKDSKMVMRWMLFGILLASILRGIFDASQFEQYFGATVLGLAATIVLATVLEVCSEGSAPIGADILTRAKAPGNSFAFLMSGVATDYTEILVLKDTTKSLKLALFLPLISVPQIILVALIINQFTV